MSATSTTVTPEHFDYIASRTRTDDVFVRSLKEAARAAGIPAIWISPEQASFMQILLKLARAREVVEVGTLAGVSAIALARALPPRAAGGHLLTLELSAERAAFAEHWIARSDVADRIDVVRGDAAELLRRVPSDSADAAFLDADKAGYAGYLEQCLRIVRRGGQILVDNAFAFGQLLWDEPTDREVAAVRSFNDRMAAQTGLHGIIVPIGDGLWVAVRE